MIPDFLNQSGVVGVLGVLGVAGVMFAAAGVAHLVFSLLMRRSEEDGRHTLRTRILGASRGPVVFFLAALGIFLAYLLMTRLTHPLFHFFDGHGPWSVRIWLIFVIAEVCYLGSHVAQAVLQWYEENLAEKTTTTLDDRLLQLASWLVPVVIYVIGALTALDVVGVTITPLIAGLGIGGIAVALALQPTLGNLFSGAFMVTDGSLKEGDFIELDGGPSGFVVEVSWRSTKIRDRFNNLIMIPNSKIMDSVMTNYDSQSTVVTVMVQCGVSYESDLREVERISLEVAEGVREDVDVAVDDFEPVFRYTAFGDSNIDFVVVMQADDRPATFQVRHELIKRLHTRFGNEGIEINYPVRKLISPPDETSP